MFFKKNEKKSYFDKELHYIVKNLQKAKAYDKKTAFATLSDKDLIGCFEDGNFFASLSKSEFQQLFQEVVTRISIGNGYITPTAKVEMLSEKKMTKRNLQTDDLIVNARCSLDNTIEFFLPERKEIDKLNFEGKRHLGLSYLFIIYHETVHARQFINTSKLFDKNQIHSLKPFDKFVAIYQLAMLSGKLLRQDTSLSKEYVDTVNELEANMRAYAVFKQNIEHGCFADTENAIKFINEKIVDDCTFNSNIQQFACTIMRVTDLELKDYEARFKSKVNKAIVKMYSEIDRQAVNEKLHKYNGYLLEAFNGFFSDYVNEPNAPKNLKNLFDEKNFVALKAIKENRDTMQAAEDEVRATLFAGEPEELESLTESTKTTTPITDSTIASEIEKINAANAKIEVSKTPSESEEKVSASEKTSKEDIINFLSEAPEPKKEKKIKDDAQQ